VGGYGNSLGLPEILVRVYASGFFQSDHLRSLSWMINIFGFSKPEMSCLVKEVMSDLTAFENSSYGKSNSFSKS
tara:strand:- start:321 stop:542 length:222 start_codon:yes stop_codon:yes gene_type:complete